jgi:hypothetical protein
MKTIAILISFLAFQSVVGQVNLDLSQKKENTQIIKTDVIYVKLINCVIGSPYKVEWDFKQNPQPIFPDIFLNTSGEICEDDVKENINSLKRAVSEDSVKKYVDAAKALIKKSPNAKCIALLKAAIAQTEQVVPIPNTPLKDNQVITATVTKVDKDGKQVGDSKWVFVLKTPEKSRWLIHYGLTYTPSLISKTDHYYSLADTSEVNKYTITRENRNGPRPWENISATINFTYPFHSDSRGFDGGFTAGFGLNAGLELSGQAGLSLIIGDNVILGTGIAMMQKYQLKGKYKGGQVIKENLEFDALHEKVWLPELYFTIGFRFGSNPFGKKTETTTKDGDKQDKPGE